MAEKVIKDFGAKSAVARVLYALNNARLGKPEPRKATEKAEQHQLPQQPQQSRRANAILEPIAEVSSSEYDQLIDQLCGSSIRK
jgi:hypothetical protein